MSKVSRISVGASMLALGILLPMAFHLVGLGSTFLPMHIPVLLSGFFTDYWVAGTVGFLTPMLSSVLTGMPPMMPPIAQGMMLELAVYGVSTSLLYRRARLNVYISLVGAMLFGRLAYGLLGTILLPLLGLKRVPVLYPITAGVLTSFPGLLLQIAVVPLLVMAINRAVPGLKSR